MKSGVFLFFTFIPFLLAAQLPQKTDRVFHYIYTNQFLSADSALAEIKKAPDYYLLKANIAWWQIVTGNDKELWSSYSNSALKSLENHYSKMKLTDLTNEDIFNFI